MIRFPHLKKHTSSSLGSDVLEKFSQQSGAEPASPRGPSNRNVLDLPLLRDFMRDQKSMQRSLVFNHKDQPSWSILPKHAIVLRARPVRRRGRVVDQPHHCVNISGSGGADGHGDRSWVLGLRSWVLGLGSQFSETLRGPALRDHKSLREFTRLVFLARSS